MATVSINAVFSENGIIKKAELAKSMHANSVVAEEESMNKLLEEYANMMETDSIPDETTNSTDTETPTEPEVPTGPNGKQLVSSVTTTDHETITGEDAKGNQVVIPGGFKIAEDSGTTVQQGIVIEDSEANQFVWIPVSNINNDGSNPIILDDGSTVEITLGRYSFDTTTGTETLVQSGSLWAATKSSANTTYRIPLGAGYYYELATKKSTTSTTPAKDLEGFINSVETNKGYYLARYEASYASGSTFGVGESETYYKPASKVSTVTRKSSSITLTTGTLWNFVSEANASTACRQMYYGDSYVESDLCNSYAWDTAIVYIQAMGNSNYANANCGTTENESSLLNTGETGEEKCKIFDMATNILEWTTEWSTGAGSENPFTCRGGIYFRSDYYTALRKYQMVTAIQDYIGFRPVIYCKTVE